MEACACKCKALIRDIGVFEDWLEDSKNVYKANHNTQFQKHRRCANCIYTVYNARWGKCGGKI